MQPQLELVDYCVFKKKMHGMCNAILVEINDTLLIMKFMILLVLMITITLVIKVYRYVWFVIIFLF